MRSLIRKIKFFFERAFLEGSWSQLGLVICAIIFVSFVGGLSAHALTAQFEHWSGAVWWAFLRLTDPGYLGDDHGTTLRSISTVLTVVGYVLFMGTLVALMTQWMWRLVRTLEEGRTPLSMRGHVVFAGLDQRTPEMIREMLLSDDRLHLFLRKMRRSRLTVVVLTSRPGIEAIQLLKAELGDLWKHGQVIVRYGRASDPDDLERVDICNAAVFLIPQVENSQGDARASTILAALNHVLKKNDKPSPLVVAEFENPNSPAVLRAFPRLSCEPVLVRSTITKILAQSVKHAGLARVFMELLSHRDGHEIYIKDFPQLIGKTLAEAEKLFDHVLPLGLLRKINKDHELLLDPKTIIQDNDRPLFMAKDMAIIELSTIEKEAVSKSEIKKLNLPEVRSRKVLVIGPEGASLPLQNELQTYKDFQAEVEVVQKYELCDLQNYHKIVLLPMIIPGMRADEIDQQTIHTYYMLRATLNKLGHHPDLLIELASPTTAEAFAGEARCDVLVPALISAHLVAHVGLRRELSAVFEEVLGASGADMTLYHPEVYNIEVPKTYTFEELSAMVRIHGHVLLGFRVALDEDRHKRRVDLAPDKKREYNLTDNDRLIILH